jgi:hypothetical protein
MSLPTVCPEVNTTIQVIEKDTKVRLKVVGTRVDQTEIVCDWTISNIIAHVQ